MPVTGRFSKQFYDRLGEQVTNELVDWLNSVDATYRAKLRELNELNFARFDAKVAQRFAESGRRTEHQLLLLDTKIDRVAGELTATLQKGLKEQTRFMFLAWSALLIPIVGLWMRG